MTRYDRNRLAQDECIVAATAKKPTVTAHVPVELAERVYEIVERLERSKNWTVKQALSAWMDQEEERRGLSREALLDVDAGRVIDHQAVQAWTLRRRCRCRADGAAVDQQGRL